MSRNRSVRHSQWKHRLWLTGVYLSALKTPLIGLLIFDGIGFLFGWHQPYRGPSTLATLLFLGGFALFVVWVYLILAIQNTRAQAATGTVLIGLFTWVALDVIGFVVLPTIMLADLTGLTPLGPLYRLVNAFTGIVMTEVGLSFWANL
jgi:hypothetical protein